MVVLSLFHDEPSSEAYSQGFEKNDVLARLRYLHTRVERKGIGALDPTRNDLIPLGMETDSTGKVAKNSYGVFHLSWKAQREGDWPARVTRELEEIREGIRRTHNCRLRFVIWAGMGGSAEDKAMYNAVGLLRRGPRLYVLDSTDPAKLANILADARAKSGLSLKEVLKATLVVGMALGMTSYEPVVNLEKLYALYEAHKLDSRPNFIYMTLPGSLLDQFAGPRGYRRVELQLDSGNATAGRHSAPMTRGSLYPLGLAGADLSRWIEGTFLTDDEIATAWRLSAFLHAQGESGRDKVTLMLPKDWEGASVWTKQDFEESLGKSEAIGIKVVIGEKPKLANYRSPREPSQDRLFLVVQRKGAPGADKAKVAALRRTGYPMAVLTFAASAELSTYMQFVHYVVFGLGYLRKMNFVTQPAVELYKSITAKIVSEADRRGGIEATEAWRRFSAPGATIPYRGGLSLHCGFLAAPPSRGSAPQVYANLLRGAVCSGAADTAELTFFGDTRYSTGGRTLLRLLDRSAERVFRSRLRMPVDIYEGPAMNHSYHEMIIGHGKCFSTILIPAAQHSIESIGYTSDYHRAQFLATQMALAERGRLVVALRIRDLGSSSLDTLDEFFRQVATCLKAQLR